MTVWLTVSLCLNQRHKELKQDDIENNSESITNNYEEMFVAMGCRGDRGTVEQFGTFAPITQKYYILVLVFQVLYVRTSSGYAYLL